MKSMITIDVFEVFLVLLCGFLVIFFVGVAMYVYYNWRLRKRKQEQQRRKEELAQKLRKMSDLSLKLWYSAYRRGMYSEEYKQAEMRQVIEAEMRRRGFSLSFRT